MTVQPSPFDDHYYKVYVAGYVFPKLPPGTPEDEVKARAEAMAEDGDIDVTQTSIEAEWDE